jgi:hypothetical protein
MPPAPPPGPSGLLVQGTYLQARDSAGAVVRFPAIHVTDVATGATEKLRIGHEAGDELGHVELSPDGARFVMAVQLDPFGEFKRWGKEIWIANRDGSEPLRLLSIDTDLNLIHPVWSPDSALLLVKAEQATFILDPAGKRYWLWPACEVGKIYGLRGWTADGQGALFVVPSMIPDEPATIYRCEFPARRTTVGRMPHVDARYFSPDQTQVSALLGRSVEVSPLAQWKPHKVLEVSANDQAHGALWSPDGRWLAISLVDRVTYESTLVLANIATGEQRVVGKLDEGSLVWWGKRSAPGVDTRRIVESALGNGETMKVAPADAERKWERDE